MVDALSEKETDLAFGLAAPVVNKIYLHQTPFWVRLSFAESVRDGDPRFRVALSLAPPDAHALADLIKALVPVPAQQAPAANSEVTPPTPEGKNV